MFKQILFIIPYVRRYRGILFQGIVALLFASIIYAAIPFLIKLAVDGLQSGFNGKVTLTVGVTALLTAVQAVLKYVARTRIFNSARGIEFEIRRDLFSHLSSLPYSFFTTHQRGDLIARLMTDVGNIRMMVGMVTLHFSSTIATTVLSLAMMFSLSPLITFLSIIPLCVLLLTMKRFMARLHLIFTEIQDANGRLSQGMTEVLSGIRVIKNYLLYDRERRRFETLNTDYLEKNMRATRIWGMLFPFIGFLGGLGTLLVMWIGGYYLMKHRISLGDFIALNTYYMMLMWPIAALGWILNLYQRGVASVARVQYVCSQEVENQGGSVPDSVAGSIGFKDVTVSKDGRAVLHNLTFSLNAGEKLLIVGPTGGGKSTLLNLILGLEQGYSGKITLDGKDLREIAIPALRKAIAIVPQDPFLYSMSIADNVDPHNQNARSPGPGFPQPAADRVERIRDLIELVNMKDEIDRFDRGIDTVIGERGIMLSGGQKQRLTLARALAIRPRILLLDDPLTHVDGYTQHIIWQRLSTLFDGLTVIVVSSRPVPLAYVDKAMVVKDGTVADAGTPQEVMDRNPYMKLLYETKEPHEP